MNRAWKCVAMFCMLAIGALAQDVSKPSYEGLLARAKQADADVDFTALRMAYAESKEYSPYGGDRKVFEQALVKKDFAAAIRLGEERLKENYLDVWAHWAVWQGANGLGDQKRLDFHAYFLRGMLGSITSSGDGKSPATAFQVISTDETYFLLLLRKFRVKSQGLQVADGHSYDAMTGVENETGEEVTLYFNVDRPLGYMRRLMEPAKEKKRKRPE